MKIKRLAEPARIAMLAMAVALLALAIVVGASATPIAIIAVVFYALPALFMDVGEAHLDAATAISIAVAAVSAAEAYLVVEDASWWGPIVMAAAPLMFFAVNSAVCLTRPRAPGLAAAIALFGLFVLLEASSAALERRPAFFALFALITTLSYLSYACLLICTEEDDC